MPRLRPLDEILKRHPRVSIQLIESITRYVEIRVPAGGFLHACLQNDLSGATSRADSMNARLLPEIVSLIYCEVPSEAWGTREKVAAWLEGREE